MTRRTASSPLRSRTLAFALSAWVLLGAAPLHAADPAEDGRVREAEVLLERALAQAQAAAKDDVERALPRLVQLHNEIATRSVRARILAGLGELLGTESLGGTRLAVAEGLAGVKDPDGAWKELKRFLPSVKEEACGPLPLRVIQSVGVLAPDAALSSLLRLMQDAKDLNVSRYAVQALGRYGWSKQRVKVLGALIAELRGLQPGGSGGQGRGTGAAARERYAFLRESLVAALDGLTGQKVADAETWLALAKEHKKRLGELFTFAR